MRKNIIKPISALLVSAVLMSHSVFAETVIYESKDTTTVTKGVTRQNILRFSDNGWYNINVLRVDLTDPYVKLDTIFSKDGISSRADVLKMAADSGAVAAVNADFFSPKPGTNQAHSVGPVVKNRQVITTPADLENKNTYGVFSISNNNNPGYSYWTNKSTITAPNGKSMPLYGINKFGWFTFLYMYDKNWGTKTPGKSDTFPTLTEMVVVNNKVKSFNDGGSTDIPKDGYVISGDFEAGTFLRDNFKVGDKVKLDIKTIPLAKSIKMAVGGGAILLRNGEIPEFSHNITGQHPRTAIGTTKDGKQAIIVAVDGRQAISWGLSQEDLAKLMLSLGAYNAMNLDGGGSTTMVSRPLGHRDVEVVNYLSEPDQRAVIDGIGVFSTAPKGQLAGLKIETQDTNIFANASRVFNVFGYDNYSNPIDINLKNVKWTSQGISGKFIDNVFYPSAAGEGKVTAELDGKKASIDVNILDAPVEIELYPTTFRISKEPQWLGVEGISKDGFKAFISSKDLKFDTKGIVKIDDNFIRSLNGKSGVVKASFNGVYSYFPVSNPNVTLDNFEKDTDKFWGYPGTVTGSYSVSDKYYKDGNHSGYLQFDFSNTDGTKGAYIKLGQDGYTISSKPQRLSVWVYSPEKYGHSIKAEVVDSDGNIFRPTFSSSINWINWKELSTTLPSDVKYPVKIKKLYVVESKSDVKNKGELYFDKLQAIFGAEASKAPSGKKYKDPQETDAAVKGGDNSFRFAAFGGVGDSNTLKAIQSANDKTSLLAFAGAANKEALSNSGIKSFTTQGFSMTDYKNSRFITISAVGKQNGIRQKDAKQWLSLFDALKTNTKDNVFVIIDTPITGDYGFGNPYEANLLCDTFSKYVKDIKKNVWVLYNSNKNEAKNDNGVKYLGIPGDNINGKSIDFGKYLSIAVNGKEVTYQFLDIK